jgi:hypothetical protein
VAVEMQCYFSFKLCSVVCDVARHLKNKWRALKCLNSFKMTSLFSFLLFQSSQYKIFDFLNDIR